MAIIKNTENLSDLLNIGKTLAVKLTEIGITSAYELKETGSEKTLLMISATKNSGTCINMLYAIEGAIQGIRWHGLTKVRKQELKEFYRSIIDK